jgi:hypothetical protein
MGSGSTGLTGEGLVKSIDGGDNWTLEGDHLPSSGDNVTKGYALAGYDDGVLIAGTSRVNRPYPPGGCLCKYNGADDFTLKHDIGQNREVSGVHGQASSKIYAVNGFIKILRSLDGGETWAEDSTYTTTWRADQVYEDNQGNVYTVGKGGAVYFVRGTWGSWGTETVPPNTDVNSQTKEGGRYLCGDETDAIWVNARHTVGNKHKVIRRDPDTGIWSDMWIRGITSIQYGLWAANSSNVLASSAHFLVWYDGATWHEHTRVSLGLTDTYYAAIWAASPLPPAARVQVPSGYLDLVSTAAPINRIVLISTYPESGEGNVPANAILLGTIASLDNVALATTTKIYVAINDEDEELVYDQGGTGFQTGWDGAGSSATVQQSPGSGVNDELVYAIDRTTDYPSEARVTVRVEAST